MAATTKIEWADATVNFWWGCTRVSAACDHCYAEAFARRLGKDLWGNGVPRAPRLEKAAEESFRLQRKAVKLGRRLKVFSNSMADFFDAEVPDAWRDQAMAVIALTPNLDWLVLTKRPKVMRAYMEDHAARGDGICRAAWRLLGDHDPGPAPQWPLPNLWLGVTAEDQKMADLRIPELLATPAARRFVSMEPLLGPVDVTPYLYIYTHDDDKFLIAEDGDEDIDPPPVVPVLPFHDPATTPAEDISCPRLDWVIAGGESGAKARPTHPDWLRGLRQQCLDAGVPFFFKQWGEWAPSSRDDSSGNPHNGYVHPEGRGAKWPSPPGFGEHGPATLEAMGFRHMTRVGKKAAGRLLDGAIWDQQP